jgi:hypothetical protein
LLFKGDPAFRLSPMRWMILVTSPSRPDAAFDRSMRSLPLQQTILIRRLKPSYRSLSRPLSAVLAHLHWMTNATI